MYVYTWIPWYCCLSLPVPRLFLCVHAYSGWHVGVPPSCIHRQIHRRAPYIGTTRLVMVTMMGNEEKNYEQGMVCVMAVHFTASFLSCRIGATKTTMLQIACYWIGVRAFFEWGEMLRRNITSKEDSRPWSELLGHTTSKEPVVKSISWSALLVKCIAWTENV